MKLKIAGRAAGGDSRKTETRQAGRQATEPPNTEAQMSFKDSTGQVGPNGLIIGHKLKLVLVFI